MRSIALANQKGGVGKTTTAVHLAHGLSRTGERVALVDLDPQGNATLGTQGMAEEFESEAGDDRPSGGIFAALQQLDEQFWILPSPGVDRNIGRDVVPDTRKLNGLVEQLGKQGFDWMLVDCPPRMDAWGWAGLEMCQQVVLPVQAEFFAMHGLSQMMKTLESARQTFTGRGQLLGVLATLVDVRESIAREVLEDLSSNLGEQMLQTPIYRDSAFVEAASHGKSLFDYQIDAKGAMCYAALVREVKYGRA